MHNATVVIKKIPEDSTVKADLMNAYYLTQHYKQQKTRAYIHGAASIIRLHMRQAPII
jgi:hypothetical protein